MEKLEGISEETIELLALKLGPIIFSAVTAAFRVNLTAAVRKPEYEYKSLLNHSEAASFLGLKKSTLYKMTHHKTVPFRKIGRSLKFSRLEIEKWMQDRKTSKPVA